MNDSPLDHALQKLGPVPAAFEFATAVAHAHWRKRLRNPDDEFAPELGVRSERSETHDVIWIVARRVLIDVPGCEFIEEANTTVLRFMDHYMLQVHKIDKGMRIKVSDGTKRPAVIAMQGHLWNQRPEGFSGDCWLTVGYEPDQFRHEAKKVVIGIAVDDGMVEYQNIEPAPDVVASLGPVAAELVEKWRDAGGMA